MLFLPRLNAQKFGWSPPKSQPRNGSPPLGFSTLITSAPRSASNIAPYGPEIKLPNSKTLMPSKQPFILTLLLFRPDGYCLVPVRLGNGAFIYLNSKEHKMATPPPVTDTLAQFVTQTRFSAISEKTVANAKMHIIDRPMLALAGAREPVAAI